ncbi:hypothetical protein [Embleya sp. NPDC001921]
MSKGNSKKPKAAATHGKRIPAAAGGYGGRRPVETPSAGEERRCLRFRFDRVDVGGPWCLTHITPEDHADLIGKLRGFESMTVAEVFSQSGTGPGKDYNNMTQCPNGEAPRRLIALDLEAVDGVSRLRLSGTKRLYGIRRGHEFSILWWDPDHKVWPAPKKGT